MATGYSIKVRKLDANWDPVYGTGDSSFLYDINAIEQILRSRLLLLLGECFLQTSDGTPLFQSILGVAASPKNTQLIGTILQQRILGTPFVTSISSVSSQFDPITRAFSFSCSVQTAFGSIYLSNQPTAGSASLLS